MTITTRVHAYRFNTEKPDEANAWRELQTRLMAQGLVCFSVNGESGPDGRKYRDMIDAISGRDIEIETAHLFNNQLNTAPIDGVSESGLRVFDWKLDNWPNAAIKSGHYVDQTETLQEARRNTAVCGYCGKQEPAAKGYVFCPHCIDSEYLKESDLYLTRMRPVDQESFRNNRLPLTEAERGHLLPLYRDAQIHGSTERGKARIAKARRDLEDKHAKALNAANAEYYGMKWLLDHGVDTSNVIFYSHTGRFGFGWRTPMSDDLVSTLLDVIVEFPYAYDIKGVSRKLSGER